MLDGLNKITHGLRQGAEQHEEENRPIVQQPPMHLSMAGFGNRMDGTIRRLGIVFAKHDRPLNGLNVNDL